MRRGARFKGKPSAYRQAGRFALQATFRVRSFPVASARHRDRQSGRLARAKGDAMSNQPNHASSRRDVYAEITSQLIAAIEADPGKPELPWRKSSGALFMPVNALTQCLHRHQHRQSLGRGRNEGFRVAPVGHVPLVV